MIRPSIAHAVLVLVLSAAVFSPVAATERGVVELEDVSEDEKVKWARATKVDIGDAIRTATAQTPGRVIEAALHAINRRLLYEIEIVTNEGRVVELYVDPQTGRLVKEMDR